MQSLCLVSLTFRLSKAVSINCIISFVLRILSYCLVCLIPFFLNLSFYNVTIMEIKFPILPRNVVVAICYCLFFFFCNFLVIILQSLYSLPCAVTEVIAHLACQSENDLLSLNLSFLETMSPTLFRGAVGCVYTETCLHNSSTLKAVSQLQFLHLQNFSSTLGEIWVSPSTF